MRGVNRGARLRAMPPDEYMARLRQQVLDNCEKDVATGCWNWTASRYRNGYGQSRVFGQQSTAHKAAYLAFVGSVPEGLEIMHSCANRACVNPDHLSVGTHAQNMRDAKQPSGTDHHMFGKPGRRGAASSQAIAVFVNGKRYGGMKEAARDIGVSHKTIRNWIDNGKAELAGEMQ